MGPVADGAGQSSPLHAKFCVCCSVQMIGQRASCLSADLSGESAMNYQL